MLSQSIDNLATDQPAHTTEEDQDQEDEDKISEDIQVGQGLKTDFNKEGDPETDQEKTTNKVEGEVMKEEEVEPHPMEGMT